MTAFRTDVSAASEGFATSVPAGGSGQGAWEDVGRLAAGTVTDLAQGTGWAAACNV